jgi:hypothetical protein
MAKQELPFDRIILTNSRVSGVEMSADKLSPNQIENVLNRPSLQLKLNASRRHLFNEFVNFGSELNADEANFTKEAKELMDDVEGQGYSRDTEGLKSYMLDNWKADYEVVEKSEEAVKSLRDIMNDPNWSFFRTRLFQFILAPTIAFGAGFTIVNSQFKINNIETQNTYIESNVETVSLNNLSKNNKTKLTEIRRANNLVNLRIRSLVEKHTAERIPKSELKKIPELKDIFK